jgi:osmotically-inducible protein OsmY
MTNAALDRNVAHALRSDPKVDAEAITASADDDGTVTLRGTVSSFRQKQDAAHAAGRVHGVTGIRNDLEVRLLPEHQREEAELRADVIQALEGDALVPATIDATVQDGVVTLTGTAERPYQREEAEFVAGTVAGVTGVENDIRITGVGPAHDQRTVSP